MKEQSRANYEMRLKFLPQRGIGVLGEFSRAGPIGILFCFFKNFLSFRNLEHHSLMLHINKELE